MHEADERDGEGRDGAIGPARPAGVELSAVAAVHSPTPTTAPPGPIALHRPEKAYLPAGTAALLEGLRLAEQRVHRLRQTLGNPDELAAELRLAAACRQAIEATLDPGAMREMRRIDCDARERDAVLAAEDLPDRNPAARPESTRHDYRGVGRDQLSAGTVRRYG